MKLSVGIGLLGCGTVGARVAERLVHERDAIERRCGVAYELRAIAVADTGKRRPGRLDPRLFTRDARSVVEDPAVDLIIECIGAAPETIELVERALDRGRHVVTANKDMLATQGPRLAALAASHGASLRFEAAVAGAIPIVRVLEDALAGEEVSSLAGVVNGTTTFVLSAMEDGAQYEDALAQAQRLGFAEADPSNDVDGIDAGHKLALLMQLAFGLAVTTPRIRCSGISHVSRRDIARAKMLGLRIRLVAAAMRTSAGALAEVAPVLVRQDHSFAQTRGADNVVRIVGRDAGELTLCGLGAGARPTGSAVLADVVSVLRSIAQRHDVTQRARTNFLEAATDVAPFFGALPRAPELPRYPIWDDAVAFRLEEPAKNLTS